MNDERQALQQRLREHLGAPADAPLVFAVVVAETPESGLGREGVLAVAADGVALGTVDRFDGPQLLRWSPSEIWDLRVDRGLIDTTFSFQTAQGSVRLRSGSADDWPEVERALRQQGQRASGGRTAPGPASGGAGAQGGEAQEWMAQEFESLEEAESFEDPAEARGGRPDPDGAEPEWLCTSCGQRNAPRFRFCLGCGATPGAGRGSPAGAVATKLVVVRGPFLGHSFPSGSSQLTIGRVEGNDVVLRGADLSRRHALLVPAGAGYLVTDLGTTNGTYVDGERIEEPTLLGPGQRLGLGNDHELVLVSASAAAFKLDAALMAASAPAPGSSAAGKLALIVALALMMVMLGAGAVFWLLLVAA